MIRKNSEHAREEFSRRIQTDLGGGKMVYMASPEDVIIKKLEYFREGGSQKHLRDIRGILLQSPIDEAYLERWISKLGLQPEWEQVQEYSN